uniref:Disease resistance protein RGA3 n=1 Tax=Nelumbo nucifera TaxID=4432 RepID=A0A822ZBI1_NELNU|nr:TPA_asm: hypothetical protein HUJ06_000712 [Nelumbo nucifera]
MAEAVLSTLLQAIFEKTVSEVFEEFGLFGGAKKEVKKLRSTLSTIQAVLEDAKDRQVTDKALRIWLRNLKDVAYDADDLLDEYLIEALHKKVETHHIHATIRDHIRKQVRNFFSTSNPFIFHYRMRRQLKEIGERLDLIAGERFKFHLKDRIIDRRDGLIGRLQTDSSLVESEIYGRGDDKEKIIKFLIHEGNDDDVSVIPIVGMGGLGMTTLAKLAYNDERVVRHFEQRIWVCVSVDFDVRMLVRAIIESATGKRCDCLDMEPMQRRLKEMLTRKRFLLVLDDVWNEDYEKWDRMKLLLRCGAGGSKIIVTTRSEKVALITGTVTSHGLDGLPEDACWSLFKQRAFQFENEKESSSLVSIGKEIVKKCRGVPLAAKTLGSLMCFKREKSEWLSVKDSDIWDIIGGENGILPALRLSYDNLPSYLQQCFAYCSIFPKDYKMKREKLIHLWVAEGFVQASGGNKPLEEVGNEYFNELLWRSFFQDVIKESDGIILECKMHDLVHDLARSVAGIDCSIVNANKQVTIPIGVRHSSLVCNEMVLALPGVLPNAKNLRSFLLLFGWRKISRVSRNLILSFRSLRVLDLSYSGIKKLSKSIATLKHLRYLDLSGNFIKMLPKSISSLCNLQTLNLIQCHQLQRLPKDMWKLTNLRHLDIHGCWSLEKLPTDIGKLRFLQTLPIFIVDEVHGCGIEELSRLNLQGELMIKNLQNVRNAACAKQANMQEKRKLQFLGLSWKTWKRDDGTNVDGASVRDNVERVLEYLQPHPDLKRLAIENYKGANFPGWLMDLSLLNLVQVSLIKCKRCANLPPFGQLPCLEVLMVERVDAAMYFSNSSSGNSREIFPMLKQLTIKDMPNLVGWSIVEKKALLPCLSKLIIEGCPKLTNLPSLPSLENLELRDCNIMLLSSVTNIVSLSNLIVSGFPELVSLPQGLLCNKTRLLSLEIRDCAKLNSLLSEIKSLTTLQSLSLSNCYELDHLPEELGSLILLESLVVCGCHSLISLPEGISGLTALQHLSLSDCENLSSLPDAMQHFTNLQTLNIWSCGKLASLPNWLGHLKSLRELEIWYCDNILCLPEGMQHLTALQFLSIWSCPNLEMRCQKGTGEDWHKIAHVPFIKINGPYIQSLDGNYLN